MKEIVAAKIGSIVTNSLIDIIAAAKEGRVSQYLDRKHMELMAACDLGGRWKALAESPTLFYIVDGEPTFVKPESNG